MTTTDAAPLARGPAVRRAPLELRDPARARAFLDLLDRRTRDRIGDPLTVMHVCGSHEQAIARFGLRSVLPRGLRVIAGPGCPVCVTDAPEVDEAVCLAERGVRVLTYGDMLRVPGTTRSLADARSEGARVELVYGPAQAAERAARSDEEIVFFATGFETTAVATAAVLLREPPPNLLVLSAHKYIPPVMEIVAEMPGTRVEGFLAAGHAAAITGSRVFEPFAERHRRPVVVAGFEPLDILAGFARLVELVRRGEPRVENLFPRCVTREGNRTALDRLWTVFEASGGRWRGIARVPSGNLRLREEFAAFDARRRFAAVLRESLRVPQAPFASQCRCGDVMAGLSAPSDCALFGGVCAPATPVGACMVSSEGTCRIWHQYGGHPDLGAATSAPDLGDHAAPGARPAPGARR